MKLNYISIIEKYLEKCVLPYRTTLMYLEDVMLNAIACSRRTNTTLFY